MKHKKQHWIPKSYLKAWCDLNTPPYQTPYVWVFPREGGEGKNKSPKNLFYESEMYTIIEKDGERDLYLEKILSEIENQFTSVRRKVLYKKNLSMKSPGLLYLNLLPALSREASNSVIIKEDSGVKC